MKSMLLPKPNEENVLVVPLPGVATPVPTNRSVPLSTLEFARELLTLDNRTPRVAFEVTEAAESAVAFAVIVAVRVADNGPGIPPQERAAVFRRFVRLGSELERSTPGTGLGLFLVKSLVRQMRGKVLVRGRQPPPGTVFEVELPAAPPA